MSFVYVNNGGIVGVSDYGYLYYNISSDLVLYWPEEFLDSVNRVANYMEITASTAGLSVKLPAANLVSPGRSCVITNLGAEDFEVKDFNGDTILTLAQNNATVFIVKDVTSAKGVWATAPWAAGSPAVTSIQLTSDTIGNIDITGTPSNPITGAGVFEFKLNNDLLALTSFATGQGFAVRTGVNNWTLRSIEGTLNQIQVNNGNGVSGNPTLSISTDLANLTSINAGNIKISGNSIISINSNGNIDFSPNGSGELTCDSNITIKNGKSLKFIETSISGTNYIEFKAGNRNTDRTYIWPLSDPVSGQLMGYTGGEELGWFSIPTFSGSSTENAIARYLNTSGTLANSSVLIDDIGNITGSNSITVKTLRMCFTSDGEIDTSSGDITLTPAGQLISNKSLNIRSGNVIRFYNGSNSTFTSLKGNNIGNATLTLPSSAGSANAIMTDSTGAGDLAFSSLTATIATKAVMETGTSNTNPVVPSNFINHQSANKAWINFNGASGSAIQAFNASIVKDSVGNYTITWSSPFSGTGYVLTALANMSNSGDLTTIPRISFYSKGTNSVKIAISDSASTPNAIDPADVCIIACGLLA